MPQTGHERHSERQGTPENRAIRNQPTHASVMTSEEDLVADVDEPPDLERTPRPSALTLHESFKGSFARTKPQHSARNASLLTSALKLNSVVAEEPAENRSSRRGMSSASTCSNHSASTAELTSDGGLTSPGTRSRTPSPPLPPATFRTMVPIFNQKPFAQAVSIIRHDDDNIGPLEKVPAPPSKVNEGEGSQVRKRCITFACGGRKDAPKVPAEAAKPQAPLEQKTEPPVRERTIKFACPAKVSTDGPSKGNKPRMPRAMSPAPQLQKQQISPKAALKPHRDSNSTVRNISPVSMRKQAPVKDRTRRLSANSDLARCEAFRFHEFASSEEEIDEWLQESTCHRRPLTINDTLKIENDLRQLGEEAEQEALEDEEDDLDEGEDVEVDEDEDDDADEDDDDDEDAVSDAGFQTDDEEGFACSDDESDAGSDFGWFAPGGRTTTAATSMEPFDYIRSNSNRSVSSSVGSLESNPPFKRPERPLKRKSRPVNIRVPSPELPDSTDFVCGTLDEDRPLEAAYMSCLERRRAAKHKITPQDIDPTFPTSDPELDEEDEIDDAEHMASESDQYLMMHGQMEPHENNDARGRSKRRAKRSPALSPKPLRAQPAKRTVHRSPPPRKLFGTSPRRLRSPAPASRLRSPPPTRRGSAMSFMSPRRPGLAIRFTGLDRPTLTTSFSLPRTPVVAHPTEDYEDEDTCRETPVRRAIDIKIGLEKKRQRRKEQLYKKMHRKGGKDRRPPPGKGYERMRDLGLCLAAHKGKATGYALGMPPTPDQTDMHVLSI